LVADAPSRRYRDAPRDAARCYGLCAEVFIARSEKPTCLILDFYGNSGKHKLITTFDILAGDMSEKAIQASIDFTSLDNGQKPVRVAKSLEEEEQKQIEIKARRDVDEARRKAHLKAKASYTDSKPLSTRSTFWT
jgi:hypothetical protein